MFKDSTQAQRNLLHLGCWNFLEKLAEMYLNTFHRRSFSINDAVKSYREKLDLKTLQLEFRRVVKVLYSMSSHL